MNNYEKMLRFVSSFFLEVLSQIILLFFFLKINKFKISKQSSFPLKRTEYVFYFHPGIQKDACYIKVVLFQNET